MSIHDVYPVTNGAGDTLREIEAELEENGGVETPAIKARLDGLAKLERITDLANYYHRLDAELRGEEAKVAPIIEALNKNLETIAAKKKRALELIQMALPPGPNSDLITDDVAIWYKESVKTIVPKGATVPIDYLRVKTETDLEKIGDDLKAGKDLDFAYLQFNYTAHIEHPGPDAIKRARARAKAKAKKNVDLENTLTEGK
jgi:hypothetical protein